LKLSNPSRLVSALPRPRGSTVVRIGLLGSRVIPDAQRGLRPQLVFLREACQRLRSEAVGAVNDALTVTAAGP
jgi:hypothetical protein